MRPHVLINCVLKGFCIVKVSSPLSCIRMMLCRVKRVKALEERSCLFLAMLIAIVMYILQIKSLTLWCIIILYSGNKIFFVRFELVCKCEYCYQLVYITYVSYKRYFTLRPFETYRFITTYTPLELTWKPWNIAKWRKNKWYEQTVHLVNRDIKR